MSHAVPGTRRRVADSQTSLDEIPDYLEIRTVEVRQSLWRFAILAAVLSGLVFAGLALIPWAASSPWVEAALDFMSCLGAGLLSIKINDALLERAQMRLGFNGDAYILRKRAAERENSVSRLVEDRMPSEDAYQEAQGQFFSVEPRPLRSSGAPLPSREEIHDRSGLR
jgi:hypothetical protein